MSTDRAVADQTHGSTHRPTLAVPRSRGAVTGVLLILLGAWGALLPFIGPSFTFGFGPDQSWHWTAARFWLQLLPGVVAAASGLLLLLSGNRITGSLFAYLAAAAGAWFVVGPVLADLHRRGYVGAPLGGNTRAHLDAIAAFYGLGAVMLFLAALAAGRLSVVGVRDVRARDHRHGDDVVADEVVDSTPVYPPSRNVDVRTTSVRPVETPVTATTAAPTRFGNDADIPSAPSGAVGGSTDRVVGAERDQGRHGQDIV